MHILSQINPTLAESAWTETGACESDHFKCRFLHMWEYSVLVAHLEGLPRLLQKSQNCVYKRGSIWHPWWLRQLRICLQSRRPGFDPWVRKTPWRRDWQPTLVLLPGESHGQRSLVCYSPWGHKKLDTFERQHNQQQPLTLVE